MSADYDEKSGFTYSPTGTLDPYMTTILETLFDEQVDLDEQEILSNIKNTKTIKKIAICKYLLYPFEAFLFRVLVGKIYYNRVKETKNLYFRFLRKKITLDQFKVEFIKLSRS